MFLALLRAYTGCRLKPRVVCTGVITLSGMVVAVGDIVAKVKGVLKKKGIDLVLVPTQNEGELALHITSEEDKKRVKYVGNFVELLQHAVEGK